MLARRLSFGNATIQCKQQCSSPPSDSDRSLLWESLRLEHTQHTEREGWGIYVIRADDSKEPRFEHLSLPPSIMYPYVPFSRLTASFDALSIPFPNPFCERQMNRAQFEIRQERGSRVGVTGKRADSGSSLKIPSERRNEGSNEATERLQRNESWAKNDLVHSLSRVFARPKPSS